MNKIFLKNQGLPPLLAFLLLGGITAASGWAQEPASLLKPVNELSTLGTPSTPSTQKVRKAEPAKTSTQGTAKAPTDITSTKGVTFDEKTRVGVFTGDVHVKDPQFNLTADKLTVFLKKEPTKSGTNEKASVKMEPAQSGTNQKDSSLGGGLDRAIAEGHVVVLQDKPADDGGEPKHYVGKANKLVYESNTGDVTLTGWPQIQQGINTQAATEESTVMVLNRDGHLKTTGGCHTIIQDQSDAQPK